MALHPALPRSPYPVLDPAHRWFPADEALRATAYERLLPPLVARIREQVHAWRAAGYAGASATSSALLRWWFETEHVVERSDDGTIEPFRAAQITVELRRAGRPSDVVDPFIAARAVEYGCPVVTRNLRHFEPTEGLRVEDWFEEA